MARRFVRPNSGWSASPVINTANGVTKGAPVEMVLDFPGTVTILSADVCLFTKSEEAHVDVHADMAGAIVSCSFEIEEPDATADPDNVNFYFDDVVVPYDEDCAAGTGWTWANEDNTEVLFCEEACAELQGGGVEVVSARFGCPTIVVE